MVMCASGSGLGATVRRAYPAASLRSEWHRWFAWFPVRVPSDGGGHWVWLETIWRRIEHHDVGDFTGDYTLVYYRLAASPASSQATSTPLDALRERLQFVAPPGPPDPPPSHASVTHCPNGHRLLWTSNRQAICDAQGTALCVAWELTVGNDGRRRLTEVVNPTARSFAYSLQKLLAASPGSALVAPRKDNT
jgi:hypothetical protein